MTAHALLRPAGPASATTRSRRRAVLTAVYYGVLLLAMTTILTQTLASVLPAELARRIGFNSEGYTIAILLGVYLQFALPRLRGSARWTVALVLAGISLTVAVGLYSSDLPSRFKTLNEAFFALALLLPYVTLARPLGRWPALISAGMLALVVGGAMADPVDSPVVLLAETFAVFVLAPLAFDVVDRGILDPTARTSIALRYTWYAALIVIPLVVVLLGTGIRDGGGLHTVLEYIGRSHEGVIGLLLTQLYFAVALGRTGLRSAATAGRRS